MPRKFDVGDSEFTIPPADIYKCRVQKCEIVTIQNGDNKGTEGYLLTFEVDDSDSKWNGKLFWDRLWFLPQNGWTWIRTLSALIPSQEWKGEIDVPDPYDLVGLKCMVEVSEGEYNGKPKNEVENYYPIKEGSGQFSGGFGGDEPF